MRYANIRQTDLNGSKVVLGTHLFGTVIDEKTAFSLLDRYVALCGNIIDTASVYANWLADEPHKSEKTIGRWLAATGGREKVIIATKGGHHDLHTDKPRLSYWAVREDLEKSLENLRTDGIDIYYLHKDDVEQQPEELMQMFHEAVTGFPVNHLGVSNWRFSRIVRANDYAQAHGLRPIIASQMQHSVARVNASPEGILALDGTEYSDYSRSNLNVFAYSAQAKGFFSKLEATGAETLPEHLKKEFLNSDNLALYRRLKQLAVEKAVSISALALAALVCDVRLPVFAQIGPKTVEQLESAMVAADVNLTADEQRFLLGE